LADAVREGHESVAVGPPLAGFSDPGGAAHATLSGAGMMHVAAPRTAAAAGRRRGHLRVLPDPTD
jgi:hypothetical protein